MCWRGGGRTDKKKLNLVQWWTGIFGTGFIINKEIWYSFLYFEPINERICWIRIKRRFGNNYLIISYTNWGKGWEWGGIYEQLEKVCIIVECIGMIFYWLIKSLSIQIFKKIWMLRLEGRMQTLHDVSIDYSSY